MGECPGKLSRRHHRADMIQNIQTLQGSVVMHLGKVKITEA